MVCAVRYHKDLEYSNNNRRLALALKWCRARGRDKLTSPPHNIEAQFINKICPS